MWQMAPLTLEEGKLMQTSKYTLIAAAMGCLVLLPQPASASPLLARLMGADSAASKFNHIEEVGYKSYNRRYNHRRYRRHRYYNDYYHNYDDYYPSYGYSSNYCNGNYGYYGGYCGYPGVGFGFGLPYLSFGFGSGQHGYYHRHHRYR